jgi:nicotinamidase-related amidase
MNASVLSTRGPEASTNRSRNPTITGKKRISKLHPDLHAGSVTTNETPSDLLLLCIDLQPVFLDAMTSGPATLRRSQLAVAAATELGIPVAFTEQVPAKLGSTAPQLRALAPAAPVWPKHTFSALSDPAILDAVELKNHFGHLLICGVETAICVYQTAADALAKEIQITILSDAVAGRRDADSAAALAALTRLGAHVLPTETVFYSILRDAQHPFFRPFTKLVKDYA